MPGDGECGAILDALNAIPVVAVLTGCAAVMAQSGRFLRLDLPPHALGKDYLGPTTFFGRAPSGTGWQVSLWGLLGLTLAREEGVEINLLGLGAGVDVNDLRLRLPGWGLWPGVTPGPAATPPAAPAAAGT